MAKIHTPKPDLKYLAKDGFVCQDILGGYGSHDLLKIET